MVEINVVGVGGRTGFCGLVKEDLTPQLRAMWEITNEEDKEIYSVAYMGEYGLEMSSRRRGTKDQIELEEASQLLRDSDAEDQDAYLIHTHPGNSMGLSIGDLISIIQLHDKADERFKGIYALYDPGEIAEGVHLSGATIKDGAKKKEMAIVSDIKMVKVGLDVGEETTPDNIFDKFRMAYDKGSLVLDYCDIRIM